MSQNRRAFLESTLAMAGNAAAIGGFLGIPRRATATTNPFPAIMQQACGESYVMAAIHDPSNIPNIGLPSTGMNWLVTAWQALDSYAAANGVYNQNGIFGQGKRISQMNPDFMRFALNQAQFGLQNDYFSCIRFSDVEAQMGPVLSSSIYWGSDLRTAVQGLITNYTVYATGNFTSALRHKGDPKLVNAMFFSGPSNREATQVAWSTGATVAGVQCINVAGGTGILSGALVGTAFELALAWTGIGLIALGVAGLVYTGYRVYTQKNGESPGPWDKTLKQAIQCISSGFKTEYRHSIHLSSHLQRPLRKCRQAHDQSSLVLLYANYDVAFDCGRDFHSGIPVAPGASFLHSLCSAQLYGSGHVVGRPCKALVPYLDAEECRNHCYNAGICRSYLGVVARQLNLIRSYRKSRRPLCDTADMSNRSRQKATCPDEDAPLSWSPV